MTTDNASGDSTRTWSGLWFGLLWYAGGFGVVLLSQFLAATIVALVTTEKAGFSSDRIWRLLGDGDVLSLTFFVALPLLLFLLYPWIRYRHQESPLSYLGICAVSPRSILIWSGIMAVVLAIYLTMGTLMERPQVPDWMAGTWRSVDHMTAFVVAVALLGPVLEEVLCRGYILKAFADSNLGPIWGAILVSGLWAMTHFQYDAFDVGWIFLLGLLLCAARVMTGSLLTPIVLHGLWNLASTIAVYYHLTH